MSRSVFIPVAPDEGAGLADVEALIVDSSGGSLVVLPRRGDEPITEQLSAIAESLDLLNRQLEDLSARCGRAAQRMAVVLLERIAGVLTDGTARPWGRGPRPADALLSKREAAQFIGISVRTFERRVMGGLTSTRVGRRIFFAVEEVERWLDEQKVGDSSSIVGRVSTTSGLRSRGPRAFGARSARANEILAELRSKPAASTPTRSKTGRVCRKRS